MTISIPDQLTTDHSGKYKVSIRLQSGGLSFSGYVPSESESFFHREVVFDRAVPYSTSLKEFFYAHDFLFWAYRSLSVLVDTPVYTLVPEDAYQAARKEGILSFVFSSPVERVLSDYLPDERAHLVFDIGHEVYEFCSRSFVNPHFIHSITPLITLWTRQSRQNVYGSMYVVLSAGRIDILVLSRGKLLFVNSFTITKADDILYYILYVWKQTGLNQEQDYLLLSGKQPLIHSLTGSLSVYLSHINPVEIPVDAYLIGNAVVQAPMDIIALSVCGL